MTKRWVLATMGAALTAGCGWAPAPAQEQQGWQTCVERGRSIVVEQRFCDDELGRPVAGRAARYGWYYFSRGYYWNAPAVGAEVPQGGSFSARPFASAPLAHTGEQPGAPPK